MFYVLGTQYILKRVDIMTYQMANLIAGKRRTSALICQPIFDKTVDGKFFFCLFDGFSFSCGEGFPRD